MRVFPKFFLIDWSTVDSIELQMFILQTLTVGLLENLGRLKYTDPGNYLDVPAGS